jgi:hypothetical protein
VSSDFEMGGAIRAAASGAHQSLSAWLAKAARNRLRLESLGQAVGSWERTFGPRSEAEIEAAEHHCRSKARSLPAPTSAPAPTLSRRSACRAIDQPTSGVETVTTLSPPPPTSSTNDLNPYWVHNVLTSHLHGGWRFKSVSEGGLGTKLHAGPGPQSSGFQPPEQRFHHAPPTSDREFSLPNSPTWAQCLGRMCHSWRAERSRGSSD